MKLNLLLALLLFQMGFSQDAKMSIKDYINFSYLPTKTSNTPSWADQLYTNPDLINFKKLKTELNDWLIAEKKEKKAKRNNEKESKFEDGTSENPLVRFALDFVVKIPNDWINEQGFIVMPTKSDFIKNAENYEKNRNTTNSKTENKNTLVDNWEQIGTMEVVENDKEVQAITNILHLDIAPSATNIRVASTETRSIFKTTDGGSNWTFVADYGGPSAFHPTDPNKIVLASNPFRYTANGGANWTILPVVADCNEIIWSNNGTTIIAATNNGVYVSSDNGANFSQKLTGSFMDVEFKPNSSTIAYAINSLGVFYKSTDAGLTWVIKSTNYAPNTQKNGFVLAVTPANPDLVSVACLTGTDLMSGNKVEIIKSINNGENFVPFSISDIGISQGFYAFVYGISHVDANIQYIGVANFLKSTDGGLNFSILGGYHGPLSMKLHPDIQDMVILGSKVILATDGGVGESPDNFTDLSLWKSTSKGLFALNYFGFDIGFNTDQMGGGKVHNGNDIFNPNWNNRKSLLVEIREAPVGKAIFSRPNSLFYADMNPKQFKQIDEDYNPIITNSYAFTLENNSYVNGMRNSDTASNTINSNIIYAGFENNVLISYDYGATSQVLKNFGSLVWDVKTTRKDSKVMYVITSTDGLWKTIDGGANWTSCNLTLNNVNLKPNGVDCYIDVSQTNANEIWLTRDNTNNATRIFKSIDGGQTWIDLNTPTLNQFSARQIQHQYGSNGGVYLMGTTNNISKCYYRSNTMPDWIDYSSNLMSGTAKERVFLKASYYKERLIVASAKGGVQTVPFYEKSNPVAQPTTNIKNICVNQEIKFSDYSILNYTGATWEWSFSKTPIYLNGTNAGSRDPIVKFLSPGSVNATLKVTNNQGTSDTKTITDFITVNYDSASCLLIDTDQDTTISCGNNIANLSNIAAGNQVLLTNFNNTTSGKFLVNLKFFTNCANSNGNLIAIVNLGTNQIKIIRYNHFENSSTEMLGNNTSVLTSTNSNVSKISFKLINNSLYLEHISSGCGGTWGNLGLNNSCYKPYVDNGDFAELQKCNNQIPQTAAVADASGILVTDFANASSGLFYVNVNGFTTCNNVSNSLKAIINLNSDVINVLEYKHYDGSLTSGVSGNVTATVNSNSTANAPISYYLSNNKLYAKRPTDPCGGGTTFRVNASCWSAMDDDQNGIDNAQQPLNCLNPLTTNSISDGNKYLVKDFSPLVTSQTSVFVNLNINSSCNNTNATVFLSVDLVSNIIHVINYRHFGSTTSTAVLNNDSSNVYSESIVNGKLKFILIDRKLYIQRVSTPCAGSTYQVVNSCYSMASQQVLAIDNFLSNAVSQIVAFPNPTTNSFTIDTKTDNSEFSMSIYNIDGKFITSKFEKTNNNLLQVNIEQFAQGVYFVVLFDKTINKYSYLKIIKK